MAKDVKCEVDSCYYWGKGDKCNADQILVNYNESIARSDVEFGMMEDRETTDDTCCETFRPKKS